MIIDYDTLKELSDERLTEISQSIEEILSDRTVNDYIKFSYDELRLQLPCRFSINQIESLKPWQNLPKIKKQAYIKAWRSTVKQLESLGLEEVPT